MTSRGQNDSGLFELNLRDERHLPFEFDGAIGCWRIDLPIENNFFDLDTLSDLILTLNYTAREGGEMLRKVANESAQCHLPGDGLAFFDVRHEFPDAWELFRDSLEGRKPARELRLRISRKLLPYIPRSPGRLSSPAWRYSSRQRKAIGTVAGKEGVPAPVACGWSS